VATSRDKRLQSDWENDQLEAVFERALTAYHRDELHGGASCVGDRILDAALAPVAREAFLDADELPPDPEVLRALDGEPMQLLGEGYHVVALVEPGHRFVVKYAKQLEPVPPLAAPQQAHEWSHDHGTRPDGSLHPAIWQHIRSFEAYGPLVVPSRIYIAESALPRLSANERRALERFRSIGIVRSLGHAPRQVHVHYPDEFPLEKRAPDGITLSVLVVQPRVTALADAIERSLRAGDVAAARELEARYREFTEQLWRCGVSHLDFSILNIGIAGTGLAARLKIFDPHIGEIEVAGAQQLRDPLVPHAPRERSIENVLRSSRDGSRWALWRVQQDLTASDDVAPGGADEAAALVNDFHTASEGVEHGRGSFGRERFDRSWQQYRIHSINTVMHAELWTLLRHPLGELVRSVLADAPLDTVYDRPVAVLGMHDDRPLAQFRAGLKVYGDRPVILVANLSDDASRLVKHWGRLKLPAEVDVQNDPAIHYHFRDLFTGEVYVRPGDDLGQRGFSFGLAPHELHVLQVEDVHVTDMAVERSVAVHHDFSEALTHCTRRVGVVGDVHGELQALKELLRALGFIDAFDHWFAHDGTLVFTGDIGHGRHLQEVFDFIHRLATEAHRIGGRIVWTLGNHDLYVDREGGQGGEDSLGYRLWPTLREAALHPERHPGLTVQAAYFEYGKLFVHGGVLPGIVDAVIRERGAGDAGTVASYVNDVLRRTLVERERISARDLPHEIFHIGTSHARERRMPGEVGYEPAGVFTPDLRELDHYRYHATLLPQVVGHTASRRGEVRYSPGSWLRRDYIAIDVGRQHGTGNGGLLLTDFGWVAVTPGGRARLIEVSPLFVRLMRESDSDAAGDGHGAEHVKRMLSTYFRVTKPERRSRGENQEVLFSDLSPTQAVALEQFLGTVRHTGQCVLVTDLDEMMMAFSGPGRDENSLEVLADYLATGGVLVFSTTWSFEWLYARLLKPLMMQLGPRSHLLANVLLILSGGREIFVPEDRAYRLIPRDGRDGAGGFGALVELSREQRLQRTPRLAPERAVYIGDSLMPGGIDQALAGSVGIVVDVGDAMLDTRGKPVVNLHRAYQRTIEVIDAATAAMHESGRAVSAPCPPDPGDTTLWTFERPHFPTGRRVRVRVGGSGFVHAGVRGAGGAWAPVYNVPLQPLAAGGYEAVLPAGVNVFTFFWTEPPWTPRYPGHWERGRRGVRAFHAPWPEAQHRGENNDEHG
jgi:hypothetical protein